MPDELAERIKRIAYWVSDIKKQMEDADADVVEKAKFQYEYYKENDRNKLLSDVNKLLNDGSVDIVDGANR